MVQSLYNRPLSYKAKLILENKSSLRCPSMETVSYGLSVEIIR